MNEQLNSQKQEKSWPEKVQEAEAALGNEYPQEFIDVLTEQGFEVLKNWLNNNNAPEDVIDFYEDIWIMRTHLEDLRKGNLPIIAAQDLAQLVPTITRRIAELGGEFEYNDYHSEPRPMPITWPSAMEKRSGI